MCYQYVNYFKQVKQKDQEILLENPGLLDKKGEYYFLFSLFCKCILEKFIELFKWDNSKLII